MATRKEMLKLIHKKRIELGLTNISDEELLHIWTECWKIKEARK